MICLGDDNDNESDLPEQDRGDETRVLIFDTCHLIP